MNPGEEMTAAEIELLVRRANLLGIRKVKLTGGEALLREDIVEIVERLSPLTDDLSMTTNGARLATLAHDLRDAGLNRVNISLHSLRRDTHREITGVDDLEIVKRGIERAIAVGLYPVKINMTILRGFNEDEISNMMEYAASIGAILQLIELQPMPEETHNSNDLWVGLEDVERDLRSRAVDITRRSLHGRQQYTIPVGEQTVQVEVVRPHHNSSFCARCTRLRVTSDGHLKPCLLRSDNLIDIHDILRSKNPEMIDKEMENIMALREPYWKEGGSG